MRPRAGSRWATASAFVAAALGAARADAQSNTTGDVHQLEVRVSQLDTYLQDQAAAQTAVPPYTQRFADAELLYRLRDYARASVLFTDIVDNYQNTPAFANSLYLLGESLYQAGDRLGARARFREVITGSAHDPSFHPFVQRALGRLIEIALRTGDVSGIDEIFAQLSQTPPSEIESQTTYVRGKYYFLRAQPDYEQSRQAFEAVPSRAPIYPQARYFLGAILTAQGRYPEAIEAFQRVLRLQPDGPEQQQVLDLSALAIGRLEIERNNYDQAIEAYQQVGRRDSPHFDRALFEQAWAFIRSGDSIRAERALEILSISNPDSPLIPEGKILWGNLLLRTGRFERAQQVFTEVRNQFGPINQQLSQMLAQNTDPQTYFQQLISSNMQVFDASSTLPPAALQYIRADGTLADSLGAVADLNVCRQYIRESEDLIARLSAAISAPSRAHVFRDMRRAREQVFEVINRITQLRGDIAASMDASSSGVTDVNLQGVITERHGLDAAIRRLPVTDAQIRRRDTAAENEFSALSQELQRNEQRVQTLESMVVAIEHYVADPGQQRGNLNLESLRTELAQHRTAITSYRERIAQLRLLISQGRSQVGVGDPRYERDLEIANQYRDMVRREQAIVEPAQHMPAGATELLSRLDTMERLTMEFDQRVLTNVDRRTAVIRAQVEEERGRVAGYRARLAQLEADASDVVGHLVMQSFASVRLHFYQIVMRADLGIVDVAWEQREEHNNRARMLAEEENREIAAYNDEFTEVTEGAGPDATQTNPASTPRGAGSSAAPSGAPAGGGSSNAPPASTGAGGSPAPSGSTSSQGTNP